MKESEDNLENFFRKRAEGKQYPFNEADWKKMEAKLDTQMPVISPFPYQNLKWMGVGAAIASLFFISYLTISPSKESNLNVAPNKIKTTSSPKGSSLSYSKNNIAQAPNSLSKGVTKHAQGKAISTIKNASATPHSAAPLKQNLLSDSKGNHAMYTHKEEQVHRLMASPSLVKYKSSTDALASSHTVKTADIDTVMAQKVGYNPTPFSINMPNLKKHNFKQPEMPTKRRYAISMLGALDIAATQASGWGTPELVWHIR